MGKNYWDNNKKSKEGTKLSSARGHPCVIGTCDNAREREATKELMNLLNQAIEEKYSTIDDLIPSSIPSPEESIQGMLAREVEELKNVKSEKSQRVVSLNTETKGVILVKILRLDIDVINLVYSIFDRVSRDKLPCSRHIVRLIPLQILFFPEVEELTLNIKNLINESLLFRNPDLPTVLESTVEALSEEQPIKKLCMRDDPSGIDVSENAVESHTTTIVSDTKVASAFINPLSLSQKITYSVAFKHRSHNTLNRNQIHGLVAGLVPGYTKVDYNNPQVVVVIEALRNVCGCSIIGRYQELLEFNLRKFQGQFIVTPAAAVASVSFRVTADNTLEKDDTSVIAEVSEIVDDVEEKK